MDDGMNGGERRQEIHAGAGSPLIEAARRGIEVSRPIAGHHALPVACRAEMPVRRHDHGHRVNRDRRAERRIFRPPGRPFTAGSQALAWLPAVTHRVTDREQSRENVGPSCSYGSRGSVGSRSQAAMPEVAEL